MNTLRAMFRLISSQNRRLVGAILLNTLLGLGALVPPYLLKVIVDGLVAVSRGQVAPSAQVRAIGYTLAALAGVRVVLAVASYAQERISDLLRLDTIYVLREQLFRHVLGLSIDYYETHKAGETVQRLNQGLYEFGVWIQELAQMTLLRVLTILLSVGVVSWVSPWAGLAVGLTVVLKLSLAVRKKRISKPHQHEARLVIEQILGHITEAVQNMTTLRVFGGEEDSLARYRGQSDRARMARLRQHEVEWRYNALNEAIEGMGTVAAVGAIAWLALHGRASAGDIILVALYMQQVMTNLRPMDRFIDQTGELIATCERILELMAVAPTVRDAPDARELEALRRIEFRGVSFRYPGHKPVVLKDISFTLEPGRMLALVGPSGTGKTTIVKLLLRLYEPTGGQILINNEPVAAFTAASLRRHIGTVMQDVALFNDSFAANVRLAQPNAAPEQVDRAVVLAHAAEFANRLPQGYDTLVGERGVKLSGGQKQRVAIARAILKQPDMVILDEATSALDSASEREVQAGLKELIHGRMAVVIAHRLSTVKKADQILVIKQGRIVEQGTHTELLGAGGLYAELFHLQSH